MISQHGVDNYVSNVPRVLSTFPFKKTYGATKSHGNVNKDGVTKSHSSVNTKVSHGHMYHDKITGNDKVRMKV